MLWRLSPASIPRDRRMVPIAVAPSECYLSSVPELPTLATLTNCLSIGFIRVISLVRLVPGAMLADQTAAIARWPTERAVYLRTWRIGLMECGLSVALLDREGLSGRMNVCGVQQRTEFSPVPGQQINQSVHIDGFFEYRIS
jgi:hypothetical protein